MLEIKNVTKTFNLTGNKQDERIALNNVSLSIQSGEFVTIIGGNGSGKSTLMNILTGVLRPDSGQVLLEGMDISKIPEHKRANYFGRVFQDPMMGTTANMSCLENLELAFRKGKHRSFIKWGFSNNMIKLYFKKLLSQFDLGLEDRLNQKVGVMSGGQRQALTLLMAATDSRIDTKKEFVDMYVDIHSGPSRIKIDQAPKEEKRSLKIALRNEKKELKEIASKFYDEQKKIYQEKIASTTDEEEKLNACIAFSNTLHDYNDDRRILLLDEHTAALDPKTAKKVMMLTDEIVKKTHLTTLMITHNMRDALMYGNRLIMLHQGKIIYDVSGEEKKKLTTEDLLRKFDEADIAAENA